MSVIVELRPDVETLLSVRAAEHGVSLAQYVRKLVEDQVAIPPLSPLSPAERAAIWLNMSSNPTGAPPLSDEAISRETLYDARG